LPLKVAFVIMFRPEQEGIPLQGIPLQGIPLEVLSFFVLTVAFATLALGYGLSLCEGRAASHRCRVPQEMLRRKKSIGSGCGAGSKGRDWHRLSVGVNQNRCSHVGY
jgi:hypothetical protein